MRILHLPLKKKWYEMIEAEIKTEEYREIKPFWEKRLFDYGRLLEYATNNRDEIIVRRMLNLPMRDVCERFSRNWDAVCFSYGYTKRRMTFECNGITIGRGRPEWGAPDYKTFIIKLGRRLS